MKITIDRKMLNKFRKECREAYPKELMAVLHGTRSEDGVTITAIKPIPHEATTDLIKDIPPHEMRRSKIKALKAGADWLGTIHSHPSSEANDTCCHPSESDIKSALKDGETVMAIIYVYEGGSRTSAHFYVPAPIPQIDLV